MELKSVRWFSRYGTFLLFRHFVDYLINLRIFDGNLLFLLLLWCPPNCENCRLSRKKFHIRKKQLPKAVGLLDSNEIFNFERRMRFLAMSAEPSCFVGKIFWRFDKAATFERLHQRIKLRHIPNRDAC